MGIFDWLFGKKKESNKITKEDLDRLNRLDIHNDSLYSKSPLYGDTSLDIDKLEDNRGSFESYDKEIIESYNKETIKVDDIREVLKLIIEFKPQIKYYTQFEYQKGYSQTNETSLNLNEVNYDVDDEEFYDGTDLGQYGKYEKGKTLYHDTVYECEIDILKLESFIDILNHYIKLKGSDCDDWGCDTFFEWFEYNEKHHELDVEGGEETLGYTEFKNHEITWCVGFNNFDYKGILIDNIKTEDKIFSFSFIR